MTLAGQIIMQSKQRLILNKAVGLLNKPKPKPNLKAKPRY